jgi:hypothetical protein
MMVLEMPARVAAPQLAMVGGEVEIGLAVRPLVECGDQ